MILNFKLITDRETIRASAPQGELEVVLRNIVGYHRVSLQIVAIGDTAEDIKRNAPEYWKRNGKHIEFVHPFNFEEALSGTGAFEPLIAARIVQWLSNKAFANMKRSNFRRMLLGPWVDRVDYDLQLDGYEKLPAEIRHQFIQALKKLLVAVHRVRINGERVLGR